VLIMLLPKIQPQALSSMVARLLMA
jgi:hypothetical protein